MEKRERESHSAGALEGGVDMRESVGAPPADESGGSKSGGRDWRERVRECGKRRESLTFPEGSRVSAFVSSEKN